MLTIIISIKFAVNISCPVKFTPLQKNKTGKNNSSYAKHSKQKYTYQSPNSHETDISCRDLTFGNSTASKLYTSTAVASYNKAPATNVGKLLGLST